MQREIWTCLFLTLLWLRSTVALAAPAYRSLRGWITSPEQARRALKAGASVLDARKLSDFQRGHVPGAQHIRWQHLSEPKPPYQGRLLRDLRLLGMRLRALGLSSKKPIVVYGDPLQGWGEEGRIVWTLRSLGHPAVAFVDGGYQALLRAGIKMTQTQSKPTPGDFRPHRITQWSRTTEQLRRLLTSPQLRSKFTLLDVRTTREYRGATPYGSRRGGHIPGALHLHYRRLLDRQGRLYPRTVLLQRLKQRGIWPSKPVVAYCTGGVRSAWMVVVLHDLGFQDARNYAGSIWEWASYPAAHYPLVK